MQGTVTDLCRELLGNVEQAIHSFACLQGEQEVCIAQGDLKNLVLWEDQRARAFARLQHALEQIWKCEHARKHQVIGAKLQEKIGSIIKKEQKLLKGCAVQRERLACEMNQARRGKKVLGHYGPSQNDKGPSYLSSRL